MRRSSIFMAMDGMYDYTDQPPHFFYIHFLVLLSALYLPLFAIDTAYAAGWGEETCELQEFYMISTFYFLFHYFTDIITIFYLLALSISL